MITFLKCKKIITTLWAISIRVDYFQSPKPCSHGCWIQCFPIGRMSFNTNLMVQRKACFLNPTQIIYAIYTIYCGLAQTERQLCVVLLDTLCSDQDKKINVYWTIGI